MRPGRRREVQHMVTATIDVTNPNVAGTTNGVIGNATNFLGVFGVGFDHVTNE